MPVGKHYDLDIDSTLSGNSDIAIASQKAVKTYVDNGLSGKQDSLPSQTGQSGKFLTTNGTTMSWAEVQSGGASALDDLSDVSISSPTSNQILQYNGTEWENVSLPEWTLNNFTGNTGTTLDTQLTLSSTPMIYRNGVFLTANTDYTISGSVITFTEALVATDIIKVINNLSFSNAPTSSGSTKVINTITTGSLTRSGASYSGFSGSNYLTLANRVDGGYLSFDNTTMSFGSAISSADNWEMVWKVKPTQSGDNVIFSENVNYASNLYTSTIDGSTKVSFYVSNSGSGSGAFDIHGSTGITINEFIYVKVEFTGSAYNLYLSSDGATWTLDATYSSSTKITRNNNWFIGRAYSTSYYMHGEIDLAGCYIKINGQMWWQGVVEL